MADKFKVGDKVCGKTNFILVTGVIKSAHSTGFHLSGKSYYDLKDIVYFNPGGERRYITWETYHEDELTLIESPDVIFKELLK